LSVPLSPEGKLNFAFQARDLAYKGLGWSIRYFMILQNNYFGSFTTFSTLFEYLEKRKKGPPGDPVLQQYRKGQVKRWETCEQAVVDPFIFLE
jgi:hypothetical protein